FPLRTSRKYHFWSLRHAALFLHVSLHKRQALPLVRTRLFPRSTPKQSDVSRARTGQGNTHTETASFEGSATMYGVFHTFCVHACRAAFDVYNTTPPATPIPPPRKGSTCRQRSNALNLKSSSRQDS
ncbi:unnamed protein product, partial [Ectocarpus sp. 12 AP-2014]